MSFSVFSESMIITQNKIKRVTMKMHIVSKRIKWPLPAAELREQPNMCDLPV
jgi:hypothetical protein